MGKQLDMNGRTLSIHKQLGEGGFSFVYLVKDASGHSIDVNNTDNNNNANNNNAPQHEKNKSSNGNGSMPPRGSPMVLKITSVHTSSQRLMAEKEAQLLKTLSHPSIVQVYEDGFREQQDNNHASNYNTTAAGGGNSAALLAASDHDKSNNAEQRRAAHNNNRSIQHLILMEYCEGGTAFDVIKRMRANHNLALSSSVSPSPQSNTRFDLPSLVIAFGQICNAVSYLHAQRPPVIHRDLKPVNFLIKHNSYKVCDFGSAVLGHTDLRSVENRRKAEEIIGKTTTQMFRAPEMVDLYMSKRLTQSTDVWALGCCLYSLAFLKDCFEEGSNLAILSRKYKIPENNPYGGGLVDLIDRMLTVDYKERADMSEVIMCLSALYSNRELPKRKIREKKNTEGDKGGDTMADAVANDGAAESAEETRVGTYRTDGQGIRLMDELSPVSKEKKVLEAKKLNPNSAAAKRKKASETNKQKEAIFTTFQFSSSSAAAGGAGGKKSSASASTRSETPISDSGEVGNFASFDQAFDCCFDPFQSEEADPFQSEDDGLVDELDNLMDKINVDRPSDFPLAFVDQESPSAQPYRAAESSFEVTFQGFDSRVPSVFSSEDHYFSNTNNNDVSIGVAGMTDDEDDLITNDKASPSPRKFFGFKGGSNNTPNTSTKKKKRFSILGKR